MVKKKREAIRQINHPADEQHPQEWIEIIYNDGSHDILDVQGNPLNAITVTASQIEKWKKLPKEQATEEILKLINDRGLDVSEKRFILDAIKTLAEIHGATTQAPAMAQAIQVVINMGSEKTVIPVINAESKKEL